MEKKSSINPGYGGSAKDSPFEVEAGQLFRCPSCKKPLLEAMAEKIYTRCKHCRKWVYIYKQPGDQA